VQGVAKVIRTDQLRHERFTRDAAVFVPKRAISADGNIDLTRFMAEVNDIVATRGMVLADGQVIDKPFSDRIGYELFGDNSVFDKPTRHWGDAQRDFFGLADPHQMAEESDGYLWWHVMAYVVESFLAADEMIVGLVHGTADNASFTCECHDAAVVYTSRGRLVCMSCGYMHVVLETPLDLVVRDTLTADDWIDLFDPDGSRRHEVVDLATVEFRDIEDAALIWQTDRWEHAAREFVFFTRTPPDELAEAIRGTELDGSLLAEAGFEPQALPPTPAWQLDDASIDLDLISNAGSGFAAGVAAYNAAYTRPDRLAAAVLDLFRAIELLLKARLDQRDPKALDKRLNNPAVLRRLADHGVVLTAANDATIAGLRDLRNKLQHSEARFNHRVGLGLCRDAIIFIDAFAATELGLHTRDALNLEDWQEVLKIPEIAASAQAATAEILGPYRRRPEASITECPRCGENALLRPHPDSGASCVHCGHAGTKH
jgi:hypothetical protein